VEIELSLAAVDVGLAGEAAVPALVPPLREAVPLPPERAAPPSMAIAQPDTIAAAIIAVTSASAPDLTRARPLLASGAAPACQRANSALACSVTSNPLPVSTAQAAYAAHPAGR
jgi:hypothetical protein